MHRRDFLAATASAAIASPLVTAVSTTAHEDHAAVCGLTFPSPAAAMKSPRETLAYVPAIYVGTKSERPDYLATVDVDPQSATYSQVIHRSPMPTPGDELHHFGWNACSSCHGDESKHRRFLVVPGLTSGNIHILDTIDPRSPRRVKTIAGEQIAKKTNLSTPHTVHCLADGTIMLSMLGDARGEGPGGFLLLDQDFEIVGRWEKDAAGMKFNYDFWYQPRHNVMISSEWAAPNTVRGGFQLDDVKSGKYGSQLHFWDWNQRKIQQTIDLGGDGLIPLECRFHHDPDSAHGFVGAALSSNIWHYYEDGQQWQAKKVVQVDAINHEGWPFPVPGLITDLVLSLDDRYLYFSNWLHGDIRQYDVSDPAQPKLTGQVWLGGVLGKPTSLPGRELVGGPQMLQLSLDGRRLYVTSSLYSVWDNQFYPRMAEQGSYLLQIDCDPVAGGMRVNENFQVDFGQEPAGPARAHEIRFPNGDSTSDIWI
jgi:selenium-binding protein 1